MTRGLGPLEIHHPPGTFALTPASFIAVEAIARNQDRFRGRGLDWGTGAGVLAIAAARIRAVKEVVGLELEAANVEVARVNAERNSVGGKARFLWADSYQPLEPSGRKALADLERGVDFIVANPPSSSPVDDGFGFRRAVIRGSGRFLKKGGIVALSVSRQYGTSRLMGLLDLDPTLDYAGVLASSDWVPFDMARPELLMCVEGYAAEEERGGLPYAFRHPDHPGRELTARGALDHFRGTGESPLSRWQSHLFVRARSPSPPSRS
ncbi:MAG: methyltransferase [Gemmatimonadetes bacterium]|nr:methyltransferase [Gemmatimonadota bacterium]